MSVFIRMQIPYELSLKTPYVLSKRYYEDLWYQKSGVFKPELMDLLPSPLQMEICFDLNAVPLYSSLIFRKLPEAFLRRLSLAMTHQFYLPGDIVYEHNLNKTIMVTSCLYIVLAFKTVVGG